MKNTNQFSANKGKGYVPGILLDKLINNEQLKCLHVHVQLRKIVNGLKMSIKRCTFRLLL